MPYPKRSHCKRDHEFTPENTKIDPNGTRHCLACRALWAREHRAQLNEAQRRTWKKRNAQGKEWAKHLWVKYKLTPDDYCTMLETQNNQCAACASEGNLEIDHNHETGKVRGLLCHNCNTALGNLKDRLWRIYCLADYLVNFDDPFED